MNRRTFNTLIGSGAASIAAGAWPELHAQVRPQPEGGASGPAKWPEGAYRRLLVDTHIADGTINPEVYKFLSKLNSQLAPYESFWGGEMLTKSGCVMSRFGPLYAQGCAGPANTALALPSVVVAFPSLTSLS